MERLTLPPKRHCLEGSGGLPAAGIPPGSLPKCATLPLDTKLPMVAGPKGSVKLFTTNLGERIHLSSQNLDFDLTDPYSMLMTNGYKPLHDPHLKQLIKSPYMRRRLRKGGFITRDGKVLCTLKEFNEWRQYLRKIHLSLEKRKEREQREAERRLSCKGGESTASIIRQKEERMREVRERINNQLEEDQQRFAEMARADAERILRIEEERNLRQKEAQERYQELSNHRVSLVQRRQIEDRQRQCLMVKKWMEEDQRRAELIEDRKRERQLQQEKKLAESWERRKKMQLKHMGDEKERRTCDDLQKNERIAERERIARMKLEQQQADLQDRADRRRSEREKQEEEANKRFQARLQRRLDKAARRKRANQKKSSALTLFPKTKKRVPKSNWNIEQTLLANFSDGEERLSSDDRDNEYLRMAITSGDNTPTGSLSPEPPRETPMIHLIIDDEDEEEGESSDHAFGDFHGCVMNDSVADFVNENSMMGHLLEAEKEVTLAVTNAGLGDMAGAVFNPSIFDIEVTQSNASVSSRPTDESDKSEAEEVAELGLADFRGADITSCTQAEQDKKIVEALPAYAALAQEQAELGAIPEREDGPNIKDVAKVMVGVSVYIASKVVSPALKRYKEEQQCEAGSVSTLSTSPVTSRPGARVVRFAPTPETIDMPESYEEEFYLDEEFDNETRRDSVNDDVIGEHDSDGFFKVQGRDSLTKLRHKSGDDSNQDMNAKDSMASGAYTSYSTFASGLSLTTDRTRDLSNESLSINADDEYEDDDFPPSVYTSAATVQRPITSEVDVKLASTSPAARHELSSRPRSPSLPASFSSMLHDMRSAYEKGVLSNEQITNFMTFGMQMIQNAQSFVRSPPSPTPTCSTNTSIMADEAVRGALQRVQQDLFEKYGPGFGQDESLARQYASANALANIIAEKALGFAANSVLKFTKDMLASTQEVDKNKAVDCSTVANELKSNSFTSSNTSGCASDYVHDILERVVQDIQIDLKNAPLPPIGQKFSSETQSTNLSFIDNMLSRVAEDTRETLQNSLTPPETTTIDSGLTDLVLGTLEGVIQSIKNETSSTDSDTAHFIRDIINQAAADIKTNNTSTQWPMKYADKILSQDSLASLLSDVVRRTLSTACHEIDEEYGNTYKSATSIFCQELVNDTIQNCIENVRNGSISPGEVGTLAAAIMAAQQEGSEDGRSQVPNGSSTSLGQASLKTSCLLDELINETLAKVTNYIKEGKISNIEIANMADSLGQKIDSQKSSPRSEYSKTSTQMAHIFVEDRIKAALDEAVKAINSTPIQFVPTPTDGPTTEESLEAMEIVQRALDSVVASSRPFSSHSNTTAHATIGSKISSPNPSKDVYTIDMSASSVKASKESLLDRFLNNSLQSVSRNLTEAETNRISGEQEPIDELQLQPVLDGVPVDLDPTVVNESLLAISARDPLNSTPSEATQRNSFLNLTRPEIGSVKQIDHKSAETISRSLISMSSKNLATEIVKNSVPKIELGGPIMASLPTSSIPKIRSQMIRSQVHTIRMEEEPEEDSEDEDSDNSDEGQFVGASEFGTSLSPDFKSVVCKPKKPPTPEPVQVPVTPSRSKPTPPTSSKCSMERQSKKDIDSTKTATPKTSRDSMRRQSLETSATNTSASKESVKRTSNTHITNSARVSRESLRRSITDIANKTSPLVSRESLRRSSTSGAKVSPRSSTKIASKYNTQSSYSRLPSQKSSLDKRSPSSKSMQVPIKSKEKLPSTHSLKNNSTISASVIPVDEVAQAKSQTSSRLLMLPRKSSPEVFIHDETTPKTKDGSTLSLPQIHSNTNNSRESLAQASSGKTIEMISSGHHSKPSKEKVASSESVATNSKQSHKNMDQLTPRPSSAFSKKSSNQIASKTSSSSAGKTDQGKKDNLQNDQKSTTSLQSDKTV